MSSKPVLPELPSTISFAGTVISVGTTESGGAVQIQSLANEKLALRASLELCELAMHCIDQPVIGFYLKNAERLTLLNLHHADEPIPIPNEESRREHLFGKWEDVLKRLGNVS
jgi:hypothetical protein